MPSAFTQHDRQRIQQNKSLTSAIQKELESQEIPIESLKRILENDERVFSQETAKGFQCKKLACQITAIKNIIKNQNHE